MRRPDIDIVRRVLKKGRHVLGDLTEIEKVIKPSLDLPLIYLADQLFIDTPVGKQLGEALEGDGVFKSEIPEPVFDEWVISFKEQVRLTDVSRKGREGVSRVATFWACFFNPKNPVLFDLKNYPKNAVQSDDFPDSEGVKFVTLIVEYEGEPLTYVWSGWISFHQKSEDDLQVRATPTLETEEYWGKTIEGLSQSAANSFDRGLLVWLYAKYGDKHMVEVLPTKPKSNAEKRSSLNKTRPWNTSSGPKILFLDRMPTTQSEGTGTHASPKPHRRRGHWKTLRHPRFRHHPQYQQKIYCKPSFVGPRQVNYEGNIYRLVQPLEDMEIAS